MARIDRMAGTGTAAMSAPAVTPEITEAGGTRTLSLTASSPGREAALTQTVRNLFAPPKPTGNFLERSFLTFGSPREATATPEAALPARPDAGPTPTAGPTDDVTAFEERLQQEGLLSGPAQGLYRRWLENAARQGVDADTLVDIARTHGITPEDFRILDGLEEIQDRDGKTFFVLPSDISAADARRAVVMTYVFNAGTDYGDTAAINDFPDTPYSAAEIQRILDRQEANSWSYDKDVGFVHGNGGRLVTTPNGMLMGLGGNWLQGLYSQQGGTAWGDIFMLNIDDADDPVAALRTVVESGRATYQADDGSLYHGSLDLDRLLHHEERHSQQWAREGYAGFLASYVWEQITGGNETEEDAGLSDGGYH